MLSADLILKGLGGVAVVGGATTVGIFYLNKNKTEDLKAFAEKVGLSCTPTETETLETGVNCTKLSTFTKNIKAKKESTEVEVSAISGGKIKAYKTSAGEEHNGGFKFVIEENDISGTNNSNKLEQFETYEIKKEGEDWKLIRKDDSKKGIKKALGLPEDDTCKFPETSSSSTTSCTVNSTNIDKIKFEGKSTASITGSGTLQITIAPSTEAEDFPLGFKFTLTPSSGSSLTINRTSGTATTIADGKSKEFKIKQDAQNKKQLTLEEAWTHESLAKKVNLTCTGSLSGTDGVNCTKANGNIKVKKNGGSDFEVSTLPSSDGGKIKVYKTSTGEDHNHGFKFVIEENDISGTTGGTSGNKLEQFETYEIKKEGSDWKLNIKTEAKVGIKKALGLDQISGCDLPKADGCEVDGDKIKKIKFEGGNTGGNDGPSGAKLKISKVENSDNVYGPFGYKFVLESTNEAKISDSLTVKANTNTEFKIKRQTNSNNITLEKAWTAESLGKKINLTCTTNGNNNECSLTSGQKINVKDGSNSRKNATFKNGSSDKKLTYEENADGYNQGIKFTTSEEICLENGEPSSGSPTSIANNGTTYEIKEDNGTWYLTKK